MPLFKDALGQLVVAASLPAGGVAVAGPASSALSATAPWLRSLDSNNADWHPGSYSVAVESPSSFVDVGAITGNKITNNAASSQFISGGLYTSASWAANTFYTVCTLTVPPPSGGRGNYAGGSSAGNLVLLATGTIYTNASSTIREMQVKFQYSTDNINWFNTPTGVMPAYVINFNSASLTAGVPFAFTDTLVPTNTGTIYLRVMAALTTSGSTATYAVSAGLTALDQYK